MIRTLGARLMAAVIGLGPTPEPAAWALRFLGLGAAGARLWARGA